MEFPRPEYWSGFSSLGDLPNPGIKPTSLTLQADSLALGKPENTGVGSLSLLLQIFPTQESNRYLLYCKWIFTSWTTSYKLYPQHCIFHTHDWFTLQLEVCTFNLFHLLLPLLTCHWQPSVFSIYDFCFVLLVHLFCFSDCTYKWNHIVFVWLFI